MVVNLQNLKDNLAVLLTIVCLFVLYIVGLIACRRQDKKDVLKVFASAVDNLCHIDYLWMSIFRF